MAVTINGTTGLTIPTGVFADSSGNVGIGTSSPEAKTSIVSSAGAIGLTIKDANAGASNYLSAQYNGTSGVADIKAQSSSGSTQIAFSTSLSGTTAERMRIDSNGVVTGTAGNLMLVQGTSQASTSGTSIDFTGIPSWAKRITVIFNGVSTSGTSLIQIQLGSTTFTTTGYLCSASQFATAPTISAANSTTGLLIVGATSAAALWYGAATICNINSNNWVSSSTLGRSDSAITAIGGGSIALSGTLDRVRITTVNGTDTFDAGTINIQYE